MATEIIAETHADESVADTRIYEIGYHVTPSLSEAEVEKTVQAIRADIESAGGSFIAEGAPTLVRLAYPIETLEAGKKIDQDRGYFGWIKFEVVPHAVAALEKSLVQNLSVLRHILFETLREDTRARLKLPTVREVKRTDTVRAAPRRVEESAATPVSEEDLDKALSDLTSD